MLISINHQVKLLVFSLMSGIMTGVLFDIYRIIRGFENPNKVITFIEDTLFWILTGIIVFVFLLYTNYAYIGFYVYVFIVLGTYFYIKLISNAFITIQYKFLKGLGKFLRILKNNIVFPIEVIIYKIRRKK